LYDLSFLVERFEGLGLIFGSAGIATLAIYVIAVGASLYPVSLLQSEWQVRFATSLINNSGFAIVGLCLVHLAAVFASEYPSLQRRRDRLAQWAVLAAYGFLLLIPLQLHAVWQDRAIQLATQTAQQNDLQRKISLMRQVVSSATTAPELRQGLQTLQGPNLTDKDLAQPLPQLRRQLMASFDLVLKENNSNSRNRRLPPLNLLVRDSIKVTLSCIALAFCFAALAQKSRSTVPLLVEWQSFPKGLMMGPRERSSGRRHTMEETMAEMIDEMSDAEDNPRSPR